MPSGSIHRVSMGSRRHAGSHPFFGKPGGSDGGTIAPFSQTSSGGSGNISAVKAEDLVNLFECPVCFDYAIPPLLQCQSGHMVCQTCREKLTFCPTCRGPVGNIRNLAMEKVASTIQFPCRYSNYGCGFRLMHSQKLDHETNCECRPYDCPCPGSTCRWSGNLDQVIPHLQNVHKTITTLQGEDIVFLATDITLPGAVDWVMMQSCFNHYFILVLEKQEKADGCWFYAVVYFVGTRKDAQNFAYKLELQNSPHRLLRESVPKSIHDGVTHHVFSKDCMTFDANEAGRFAENGNLGINVQISLSEPRRNSSLPYSAMKHE